MDPFSADINVVSLPYEWKVLAVSLTVLVYIYILEILHRVCRSRSRKRKEPLLGANI